MSRYATLLQLKDHISVDDSIDDVELELALDAAERLIDDYCRRRFDEVDPDVDAATERTYRDLGYIDDVVDVDKLEVRYSRGGDWQQITDYDLEPFNAASDGQPHTKISAPGVGRVDRVKLTGWFGWPETPAAVTQATVLQSARVAQRRAAPFGIQTVPQLDGGAPMRLLAKLDADVELLLHGLRRNPVMVA